MSKILVVDIDETLVYSVRPLPESIKFEFAGCSVWTCPRPGAHQFLQEARKEGWVIISVTQGVVPFQEKVLAACGLLGYFDGIFGWADTNKTEVLRPVGLDSHNFVMVDNRSYDDWILQEKQGWMGVEFDPEVNFVECEDWVGHEVPCLTTLLPRIKQLMDAQS